MSIPDFQNTRNRKNPYRGNHMLCEVKNLSRSFLSPEGAGTIEILKTVSLAIGEGESLAIVGPSGSGKTTLLNIIATLDRPDAGSVSLDGEDVSRLADRNLSELRNRKIGIVFQHHCLLPQCTLLENILLPTLPWPATKSNDERIARAVHLARRVGLQDRLTHRPAAMSGGECQRGAVIRALINSPRLLCADEPTGSLDRASAEALGDVLIDLNREEKTALLVVTHSRHLALRMDRCLTIIDGKLEALDG